MEVGTMDIGRVAAAAAEVQELVRGDGADLLLLRADALTREVDFRLDLDSAGCADCVLPPEALHNMVDAALKKRVPGAYTVVVDDPRVGPMDDGRSVGSGGGAGEVTIVDPAAEVADRDMFPGPDAGDLRGKTVGFRVDVLWRSWDWVVDEWCKALAGDGVSSAVWRRAQGLDGAAGDTQHQELGAFLGSVDAAVVGLGNCGSCTSWTIKDSVAAVNAGLPTVGVTTAHFEQLGRTLAANYGRAGLRLYVLPYPLDTRPEEEVRGIARDTYGDMLKLLGAVV